MIAVMRELRERRVVTRTRVLSSGRTIGGIALTKGPLAYLLRTGCISAKSTRGKRAILASIQP
jgi:hypothetical protein